MAQSNISSSSESSPIVRAIDVGYGQTKFVVDDRGSCRLFPSLAPPSDIHRARTHIVKERLTREVWVDGVAYETGPDTNLFREVPVLHGDYIETPQYRALLYGALDAMCVAHIDLLVTGLPVHQHSSRAARLKEFLTGVHSIRPGVSIEIREVVVAIQPLGGLLSHTHERGNWATAKNRTYLLVDPGYVTFDWLATRGMNEIPGRSGSLECGVSDYLTCIQEHLARELGEPCMDLRRIDEGLREGQFRVGGRKVDLGPSCEHAETIVERAIRALRNRLGTGQEIDEIVVVGGGGAYFMRGLQRAFPNREILISKDPVFANVRGFHVLGKTLIKQRAA